MTNFQWRPATDSDLPFIAWMDELTETFGDESQPLPEDYVVTRRQYGRPVGRESGRGYPFRHFA